MKKIIIAGILFAGAALQAAMITAGTMDADVKIIDGSIIPTTITAGSCTYIGHVKYNELTKHTEVAISNKKCGEAAEVKTNGWVTSGTDGNPGVSGKEVNRGTVVFINEN